MDQLKSNKDNSKIENCADSKLAMPKRTVTLEFLVGLFTLAGLAATGYLAMGLGGLELFNSDKYHIIAQFDNISGLKQGASVEIAGVPIGSVTDITLKDPIALVTLNITKAIKISDDDIASIRTKGIIGDRYVKISRGSSNSYIPENGKMTETESVIDIEDIIGKIVHSLSGEKEKPEDDKAKAKD